jgi:hypothetical protein
MKNIVLIFLFIFFNYEVKAQSILDSITHVFENDCGCKNDFRTIDLKCIVSTFHDINTISDFLNEINDLAPKYSNIDSKIDKVFTKNIWVLNKMFCLKLKIMKVT